MKKGFGDSSIGSLVLELFMAKYVILLTVCIAVVLSIGYIKLMERWASKMAWISLFMVWIGLILVGVGAYIGKNDALVESYLYGGGEVSKNTVAYYKTTYWCAWIFAGLYCLCAIF